MSLTSSFGETHHRSMSYARQKRVEDLEKFIEQVKPLLPFHVSGKSRCNP